MRNLKDPSANAFTFEMFNHMSRIPSKALGFTIFRDIFKKPKPVRAFTSTTMEEKIKLIQKYNKRGVIQKYNTKELIEFLREIKELHLEQEDLDVIEKEKISGDVFLNSTREELQSCGLKYKPAIDIAELIREINTKRPTGLVHVFVDKSNVFTEASLTVGELENYFDRRINSPYSYFRNLNVDYGRLLMTVQDGRKLGASPVIVGSRPSLNDSLWSRIQKLGYDVTVRDRNFDNVEKKIDNTIMVAMMNTTRHHDPGIMVLISGDGNFDLPIQYILEERWTIETWFWTSGISEDLKSKTLYKPLDNLYKSFTYGYGPDTTGKKYRLIIYDPNIIQSRKSEKIMDCYIALNSFCWYNRLNMNTFCLYFDNQEQLESAKSWMKTNHPEVLVFLEDEYYLQLQCIEFED